MAVSNDYDVFLSYKWRDHAAVEPIARALTECGLRVFFDRWYLVPGRAWVQALEETLRACRAVAVCIGPGEMDSWQQRERDFALERQAHDNRFPVIPLLLPGADAALGFLGQNTWIDLRAGTHEAVGLVGLAQAIRGEPPGPDAQARLGATFARICPYRGLLYFREEDAPFFFGRALAVQELMQAVQRRSFIAVVGASGCGKSSIVRAGLVPALRHSRERIWEVITLVPGERPFQALATAIAPILEPPPSETERLIEINKLSGALERADLELADVIKRVIEKQTGTDRLLLIVDQFEELYTLTASSSGRRRFIDQLLEASSASPLSVVTTLRGDFVGQALAHRQLADHLQGAQINIGPMTRAELEQAIRKPVQKVGLEFERGLVERILDDVGEEPGNLPLLEFVLKRLWEDRKGNLLLHDAYEAMGQLHGAVASKAEDVFSCLSQPEQEAARRLFLQLVRPGEGVEDTRRRATRSEIGEATQPIIHRLARERLLVTAHANPGVTEQTVEIAHEALIRNWSRLKGWLDQDREFLLWHERLRTLVAAWRKQDYDEGALLRGALLVEAERWSSARDDQLSTDERNYLAACLVLRTREQQAEEDHRERELTQAKALATAQTQRAQDKETANKRLKRLAAALGIFTVVTILVAWFAQQERSRAEQLSRVALSRQLAAQSVSELERRVDRALLLSLASAQMAPTFESKDSLLRGIERLPRRLSFLWGHQDRVHRLAFSPDGKTLASGSEKGAVILWDVASRKRLGEPLSGHTYQVESFAFRADGKRFVSAALDQFGVFSDTDQGNAHVIVWDVASLAPLGEPLKVSEEGKDIDSVALSPDGKTVVVAASRRVGAAFRSHIEDATVTCWDVDRRVPVTKLVQGSEVQKIAFSPNGAILGLANRNGEVVLLDAVTRKPLGEPLKGDEGGLASLVFSADGSMLAVATESAYGEAGWVRSRVTLWDVASRKLVAEVLEDYAIGVADLAFSPDGRTIAVATWEDEVVLWDVKNRRTLGQPFAVHRGPVSNVAFSPDGETLATGSWDKTVMLWDWSRSDALSELLQWHPDPVHAVAFSADGKTLAAAAFQDRYSTGQRNGVTVRQWTVANRTPLGETLQLTHRGAVEKVAFSPDGRTLGVAGNAYSRGSSVEGFVTLWDVENGAALGEPLQLFADWLAFGPDGGTLAAGGWRVSERVSRVALLDVARAALLSEPFKVGEGRIGGIALSPDGSQVAVADEATVTLWDVTTRAPSGQPFEGNAYGLITFTPDGKTLVAPGGDPTVRLWEIASRHPLGEPLEGPRGGVETIAISPDSKTLAVADGPRIWLWDMATRTPLGEPLQSKRAIVHGLAFSPDGSLLAAAQEGGVMLWNLDSARWRALACHAANRNLTGAEWSRYVGDAITYAPVCPDLPLTDR